MSCRASWENQGGDDVAETMGWMVMSRMGILHHMMMYLVDGGVMVVCVNGAPQRDESWCC